MARRGLFADEPINIAKLPSFRAEHLPVSGPFPWLDRSDALKRIDQKLLQAEINNEEAEQCRHWVAGGYIVLKNLLEEKLLDEVWAEYEKAIRAGKIVLPAEPASNDDPYPGRCLNPHKRAGAFCQAFGGNGKSRAAAVRKPENTSKRY